MAKKDKAETKKLYDELAERLKGTSPERLQDALIKTKRVALRMTRTDKTKLDELAKKCGLTATELVTRLIDFAWDKLKDK
ncbi:MAG: hypothetical protein WCT04_26440 [Planctomycetota bacterium]